MAQTLPKTESQFERGITSGLGSQLRSCPGGLAAGGHGRLGCAPAAAAPRGSKGAPAANWVPRGITLYKLYHFMKPLVYKMFINICGLRYTGLFLRFKLNKLMNGWPFLPKRAMRYIIPLVYDGLGTA